MKAPGVASTVTPPASASAHSPRAQRLGGEVHRDQRGGAGGVDGHRRALEAEGVGDAAGGDAGQAAGAEVALQLTAGTAAGRVVLRA